MDARLVRQQRREFLYHCGLGLGSIALASLIEGKPVAVAEEATERSSAANPLAPRRPHFAPRAKAVIQLFMAGGPSQLELFDYKPKLQQWHNQDVPQSYVDGKRFAFLKPGARLLGTKRSFHQFGETGTYVSELLPHTAQMVDQLALIKTMTTDNFNHGPAKLLTQTGFQTFGYPAAGCWVLYGLGSETQDLPGFVVLQSGPRGPRGGSYLWSNGFLSSALQGVPLRTGGEPILNLNTPAGIRPDSQRRTVETIGQLNALRYAEARDQEIAARTASYEMAFRMQASAPDLIDISDETPATLQAYGVQPGEPSFAFNCLLARRLVERGVRFVTLFHTNWDHHGGSENLEGELEKVCHQIDQSSYALVQDLRQRGLLDETLVLWGGEFGRTPLGEDRKPVGRDHHIDAYTLWLAGGGIKTGQTIGATDELGFYPTDEAQRVHVHDLQATLLHLLGLDHRKLTYRFQGRDFRLTDVGGQVVQQLLA